MSGSNNNTQSTPQTLSNWGTRGTAGVSFAAGLSFEDVRVQLGGNLVLDKLSFSIEPGEIVCLLGQSGSGKSTILRVAAGIQPIDAGRVRINQQIVSSPEIQIAPEKRGIGLMFQDFALFPHMTLLQNVTFGLDRLDKKEANRQAMSALRRVGLDGREGDYPHMLSGGQQQRLALARTIAPRPSIIMLDEPFSGLDSRMRESVRDETLAVLRETGATGLIVTHDPAEAMLLGDRIAVLHAGRLVQIAPSSEVYSAPADLQTARFLTHLSEVHAVVSSGEIETPLGKVPAHDRAEGQKVVVGIRPVGDIQMEASAPGTPGRIVSKREALGIDIFEVKVSGMEQPVRVRQPENPQFHVGKDVFLRLNPQQVLVFDPD